MKKNQFKRNIVLGTLFFLPVAFLLFLYPSTHNYNPLDIVQEHVADLDAFSFQSEEPIKLKDHLTILGFLGTNPMEHAVEASNIKELVYDKFKGFKRFQLVFVMPQGTQEQVQQLHKEVNTYEDARFWYYVYGTPENIQSLYKSLKSEEELKPDLSSEDIFIIDKDLNQRGRLEDRDKKEIQANLPGHPLYGYNCIDIGTIKNKMSDDMRVLFTEYRQKRKGNFNSIQRRDNEINQKDEQAN